jgi:restriction system protein
MIPDYQSVMLPILKILGDNKPYSVKALFNLVAKEFKLTDEELKLLMPNGRTTLFKSRVYWANSHLKKSGLVFNPEKYYFQITERGLSLIKTNPEKITIALLKKLYGNYYEYFNKVDNKNSDGISEDSALATCEDSTLTPLELMDKAFQDLNEALLSDVLEKIRAVDDTFFEELVVELIVKMGYGGSRKDAGKAIGKSHDGGLDGIVNEDRLGLDRIYIQAKKYKEGENIGRPDLQKFVGALAATQGIKKGIFITTFAFTKGAREYVPKIETKVVLIDGINLAELMIEHNLGVSEHQMYVVKKIDNDYFDQE